MEIISVGENDWDDLRTIRLASLKDSPNAFAVSYETALNYTEAEWRVRASGAADRSFFIAKVDSLFVGIVGGLHGREEYELISMWVSPNHRENGIAKALINKSVAHAKNLKKVSIFLEVTSNNTAASNLYKQCGFSLVSSSVSTVNGIARTLNKFQYVIQ